MATRGIPPSDGDIPLDAEQERRDNEEQDDLRRIPTKKPLGLTKTGSKESDEAFDEVHDRINSLIDLVEAQRRHTLEPLPPTTGVSEALDSVEGGMNKNLSLSLTGRVDAEHGLPEIGQPPFEVHWGKIVEGERIEDSLSTPGGSAFDPKFPLPFVNVHPGHYEIRGRTDTFNPHQEIQMHFDGSVKHAVYFPTSDALLDSQNDQSRPGDLSYKAYEPQDGALPYVWVGGVAIALGCWIFPGDPPEAPEIHWGVAADDWVEGGDRNNTFPDLAFVAVLPCANVTGQDPQTAPVIVYLPPLGYGDPNVREGDVVMYRFSQAEYFCLTPYMDDKIGTVKMWINADAGAPADIPGGWALCDGNNLTVNLSGKFVVQYNAADVDYDALGKTGGFKKHGADENDHDDHILAAHDHPGTTDLAPEMILSTDGTQQSPNISTTAHEHDLVIEEAGGATLTHTETDNRPPYFTVFYIQRVS